MPQHLPPEVKSLPNLKALKLMAAIRQWQIEDATDDPDELDRRERETAAHHAALDQIRRAAGMRLLFPDEDQAASETATPKAR